MNIPLGLLLGQKKYDLCDGSISLQRDSTRTKVNSFWGKSKLYIGTLSSSSESVCQDLERRKECVNVIDVLCLVRPFTYDISVWMILEKPHSGYPLIDNLCRMSEQCVAGVLGVYGCGC